jgi:hypothetical protein
MPAFDTFYTLFTSMGADNVLRDEERLKRANDDLEKSFKNSDKQSNQFSSSLHRLGEEIISFITVGASLTATLGGIKGALNYAVDIDTASRTLGVNVQALDAWGNAVQRTGGNLQTFESSLRNLAENLGRTGEIAIQILPQLADNFQKLGRFGALRYGKMLGLDEATILLLQKGRREVDAIIARQKELGLVTKYDAEQARKFNFAWQDATHSLRVALLDTALAFLPLVLALLKDFTTTAQYFSQHSDVIVGGLTAIGLAAAFATLKIKSLRKGVLSLTGAAALGVIYEDIKAFREGKPSFIGDVNKKFPITGRIFGNDTEEYKSEKSRLSFGHDDFIDTLRKSYQHLIGIDQSPINYLTPYTSNIENSALTKGNLSINIGDVYLQTQATDVNGIAAAFARSLNEQLRQTIDYYDDGVQV